MASAIATTTQTALCIIPPESIWTQIQAIRSVHDNAYPRWMPHINLVYPFVPEGSFENAKTQLESVLKREKPFQIRFDQSALSYFKQRGEECTYHLKPTISTDVVQLQKRIQNGLPDVTAKKRAFEAHLTLGQTTTSDIENVLADLKAKWQTIEFTVDRVYMISRENHPENLFVIKNEIFLLDQPEEPSAAETRNSAVNSAKPVPRNYLCLIAPNTFAERFSPLFQNTSFQAAKACRIVLADYENGPVDPELRSKLQSTAKFTLTFDQDALKFDETTSRLLLQPANMDAIHQLNVLNDTKYDGGFVLGELRRDDFDKVNDQFKKNCSTSTNNLTFDRIHLADMDGKTKFIFRLKNL